MVFAKEWIFKNVHVPTDSLVLFTVNGDSMVAPTSQIKAVWAVHLVKGK